MMETNRMRIRNPQAARLEQDYLSRVRAALAGSSPSEIEEVILSVQEHIEEELSQKPPGDVTLVQMADVLERLGPPEEYAVGLSEPPPLVAPPAGGFDFGNCWNDTIEVYKRNFWMLVLGYLITTVLMVMSLFILTGPLVGGFGYAMVLAMRRPDKTFKLEEIFNGFSRFWTLFALFIIQVIPIVLGYSLLIIPGLLLSTIWLYTELLVMDKGEGVWSSLRKSYRIVKNNSFGTAFLIVLIGFALGLIPQVIHYVGFIISLFISPLAWLLMAAAYNRSNKEIANGELQITTG